MRPRFDKVNTSYDVGPDHVMIYAHVIIPKNRESELRTKFNNFLLWYMSRNRILGINNKAERYPKPAEYVPKYTNGKRGRPKLTIDNNGNIAEVEDDDSLTD